ncbi:ABC transporter [Botrytis cinerea]
MDSKDEHKAQEAKAESSLSIRSQPLASSATNEHDATNLQAITTTQSNTLSLSAVEPVDVQIRNLSVNVDISPSAFSIERWIPRKKAQDGFATPTTKQILHSVSASMPIGTLTAIIGGSGSGKTTMLNTMAERMTSGRLTIGGTTTFNGMEGVHSIRSAYVMQQDVLLPTLTVRETLRYAADLRLPPPTTEKERRNIVEEVILELGLKECADTRIGSTQHKGCSGGEKRRTSIGVQLLSNPSVLFLDEPTTGLDATSAFQLSSIFCKAADCLSWFKGIGMELPAFVNPAEFLIDIAAIDNRSPELEEILLQEFFQVSEKSTATETPNAKRLATKNWTRHSPFVRQTRVLTSRTFVTTYRDPMGMFGSLIEAIGMGIMSGREGALYNAAALQGYLMLLFETYRLTIDIQLFDRENNENVVDVIPFCSVEGLQAASRNFAGASLIANMGYTVQSFACGFFVQVNTIPVYVRWLKWTAYVFYAFGALCSNEFVGQFYDCPYEGGESNPACVEYTGAFIIDSLGFPDNWVVRPIIFLLCYSIMFYGLAGIGLRFIKVEMTIARARGSDADFSAGKEKMTVRSAAEVRTVDIGLDKFALDLEKRNSFGRKQPTKTILNPVTATFQAGVLNVIMGPSGSGKTSLLNAMALRLRNSIGTKYRPSGDMTFNGAVPSDSVIRSVCCYVCQDDDALLSSLTVRETLHFAAGLRLPSFMTKEQKTRRAEDVLLKMGLKDCADNLIGSDLIKGISGGEKRRVTIAVQILTDPRVLLLDEPTSGLDAFTASSIMEVLQGLAQEGRTLILTIHQSRSDTFKHFGSVLLLARGGFPVYAGKGSDMISHFDNLGHPCPTTTNPADFALDLITIDLQQSRREEATRSRVRDLINSWSSGDFAKAIIPTTISTPAELGSLVRKSSGFFSAYPILVHRASINFRRQPDLLLARTMQVLGLAMILALFFAPLKHDYYSVQNRFGFIQEFCAFYFVENDDGIYSVEAFFSQYTTLEIPFEIFTSLIFAILTDLATGLPRNAQFNTLFSHTGFAVNLTSVFLSIAQFMSGIMSIGMPAFLQAVNYLSPIRYAIRNLAPYTLRSIVFTCTDAQKLPDGSCPINTGVEALDLYDLNTDALWNIIALGICTLIYRGLAYVLLKGMRTHWKGVGKRGKGSENSNEPRV